MMTEIRILLYTDYEEINENPDLNSWGVTELKKFIVYKTRGVAECKIDLIYRHASIREAQKLTHELLCQYDELWVFGFNSVRMSPYELDAGEVEVLKEWMDKGGGLLMAGDHAAGFCDTDPPETFSLHGRSLGEPMKRAGQLRVWQGPPRGCPPDEDLEKSDNFNTCEGSDPSQLDDPEFQSDSRSQTLLASPGTPHRLFWWRIDDDGQLVPIRKFPDHMHEGKLIVPDELDDEWPPDSPAPVVAAKGRDKRFPAAPREYNLVVAYDGDPVKVGRIVADSSFHHFINVNLGGLSERDATGYPKRHSDLDQVAQYFGNLALWLAPQSVRDEIKFDLPLRMAIHPDVFEVRGSGVGNLGKVAQYGLNLQIGASNLHRLFAPSEFEMAHRPVDELLALLFLGDCSSCKLTPEQKVIVQGAIVHTYHTFIAASGAVTPHWLRERPLLQDMLDEGGKLAVRLMPALAENLSPLFQRAFDELTRSDDD